MAHGEAEGDEALLGAVVQVALQTAALGLGGGEDPRARGLDLCKLDTHFDAQPRDLHGQARGAQHGLQRVGALGQPGRVQDEAQLEVAAAHGRAGARIGRPGQVVSRPPGVA